MSVAKKHRLVCIGWLGDFACYLDVPREEAMRRYRAENPETQPDDVRVTEFEFEDEFYAYEAGPR